MKTRIIEVTNETWGPSIVQNATAFALQHRGGDGVELYVGETPPAAGSLGWSLDDLEDEYGLNGLGPSDRVYLRLRAPGSSTVCVIDNGSYGHGLL